jgi:hypothetical protein
MVEHFDQQLNFPGLGLEPIGWASGERKPSKKEFMEIWNQLIEAELFFFKYIQQKTYCILISKFNIDTKRGDLDPTTRCIQNQIEKCE